MRAVWFGPQLTHYLDILTCPRAAPLKRNAQRSELLRQPPDADAENKPPPAQPIDGRHRFGQDQWVVFGNEADPGPKANGASAGRRVR